MDLRELYETNADFRGYVDRHAKQHGISVEEALKRSVVKCYAECLAEQPRGEVL